MAMFQQQGNTAECVQWTGGNLDEVKDFVLERSQLPHPQLYDFFVTVFKHLVIVYNEGFNHALVIGGQSINRGTWLVDQGPEPENPNGFVICAEQRFNHLYKPVT